MGEVYVAAAWSSGKDSAWMLHRLRSMPATRIACLFTMVSRGRVAVHEVPVDLLDAQAQALGLPLHKIALPDPCPNAEYEAALARFFAGQPQITHAAYGDLFLEDIRAYRERHLAALGIAPLFPLWGEPTRALAEEMLAGGLRAWITAVDLARAPAAWAGRAYDAAFLAGLPAGIDACGERGEFHTFAFDGPMFRSPIACHPGSLGERDGFCYSDLEPGW